MNIKAPVVGVATVITLFAIIKHLGPAYQACTPFANLPDNWVFVERTRHPDGRSLERCINGRQRIYNANGDLTNDALQCPPTLFDIAANNLGTIDVLQSAGCRALWIDVSRIFAVISTAIIPLSLTAKAAALLLTYGTSWDVEHNHLDIKFTSVLAAMVIFTQNFYGGQDINLFGTLLGNHGGRTPMIITNGRVRNIKGRFV